MASNLIELLEIFSIEEFEQPLIDLGFNVRRDFAATKLEKFLSLCLETFISDPNFENKYNFKCTYGHIGTLLSMVITIREIDGCNSM